MIGIEQITDRICNLFDSKLRKPASVIPSLIMICGLSRRPGLSTIISAGKIIQDLASKGIPTETLPDGTPNMMNQMVTSIVSEVYRSIKEDINIQVAMQPGAINVVATGANAGGPVVCEGFNINFVKGKGLAQ